MSHRKQKNKIKMYLNFLEMRDQLKIPEFILSCVSSNWMVKDIQPGAIFFQLLMNF